VTTGGGPFEALVLAAGAGSRFGGAKLTAPWRGGRLIDGALAAAFAAPVGRVMVVTGADPAVAACALAFADAQSQAARLALVHADRHADGLSASLKAGLAAVSPEAVAAFVFLGDMPSVPQAIARRLADAMTGGVIAAAPAHAGRRGHPALIGRALFSRLAALEGDAGAGRILDGLGERLVLVETDDAGVLYDVDRKADLTP
jgi:molybdenum cofactor cytidylyltransferase